MNVYIHYEAKSYQSFDLHFALPTVGVVGCPYFSDHWLPMCAPARPGHPAHLRHFSIYRSLVNHRSSLAPSLSFLFPPKKFHENIRSKAFHYTVTQTWHLTPPRSPGAYTSSTFVKNTLFPLIAPSPEELMRSLAISLFPPLSNDPQRVVGNSTSHWRPRRLTCLIANRPYFHGVQTPSRGVIYIQHSKG